MSAFKKGDVVQLKSGSPKMTIDSVEEYEQHLDNLRRKDSLRGAETTEISVCLGNYSASHFEGSAYGLANHSNIRAICIWFDGGERKEGSFSLDTLAIAKD